jgi:hypothetical protein
MFSNACRCEFIPGRYFAVDKAMIRYKSTFAPIKHRMPHKPKKVGIAYGHCFAFEVFLRKGSLSPDDELSATSTIVKRLAMQPPTFTSVNLFDSLSGQYQIKSVGTARGSHVIKELEISSFKEKDLERGQAVTISVATAETSPMTLSA